MIGALLVGMILAIILKLCFKLLFKGAKVIFVLVALYIIATQVLGLETTNIFNGLLSLN